MLDGLGILFCLEFWQEYGQFWQLTIQGEAPWYLFVVFNMMLMIGLIIITSPVWVGYILWRISKI